MVFVSILLKGSAIEIMFIKNIKKNMKSNALCVVYFDQLLSASVLGVGVL